MKGLARFGVSIPHSLLERFDAYCRSRKILNRSEGIRDLIRDALVQVEQDGDGEMVGALTLVYDHHVREISDVMTDFQHKHVDRVVSSLHVHLDRHLCLEVIVLRGRARDLRRFSDRLLALRGVRHGKLVLTSPGLAADQ
jgi:CopG family nickel-responsive transcriptional regulator